MIKLSELVRINHGGKIIQHQLDENGFIVLYRMIAEHMHTPVYYPDGRLVPNTDCDPFIDDKLNRTRVGVVVDSVSGRIVRRDEFRNELYDVAFGSDYILDMHGGILTDLSKPAPKYNDIALVPTVRRPIPRRLADVVPNGLLANRSVQFVTDYQFYQVPTSDIEIRERNGELMEMAQDKNLDCNDYEFLTNYAHIIQDVHTALFPEKNLFSQYAQIRNMLLKNTLMKKMGLMK